jgi:hypothetical protein
MSEAIWSLTAAMRRLWADQVIWTRRHVVAAIGDTHALDRLLLSERDKDQPLPRCRRLRGRMAMREDPGRDGNLRAEMSRE